MFPFWDLAVEPALRAAGVRRLVEIGALRGETTIRLLTVLGDDSELHVIDPVPAFDPTDHEREFPGRYLFHRDVSHSVLPDLPAMDAALVDGDHNWFTVYHELHMLSEAARKEGKPLPLLILHDVGWPYGRRDLYYEPDRIPEEHRQPYERLGMLPGHDELVPGGGMNATLCNARHEGGPRNGVMTALDDFMAEYDRPLRRVVLPVYFGLAIVAEEAMLEDKPALVELLDWLEGTEGQAAVARLAEDVRIEAAIQQQAVLATAEERTSNAARRYLDLLTSSLVQDDRSPRRRFALLERCLDTVRIESVAGDVVECGSGVGETATYLRGYLAAHDLQFQRVFVADPYDAGVGPFRSVRELLHLAGLLDSRVRFLLGPPASTLAHIPTEKVALLHVGGSTSPDLLGEVLSTAYDRISVGGFVVIDGYDQPERAAEVDGFRARRGIDEPIEQNDAGAAVWRKTAARAPDGTVPGGSGEPPVPLQPPCWVGLRDLTVVVDVNDGVVDPQALLRSLTRARQEDVDGLDYEVFVVDTRTDHAGPSLTELLDGLGDELRLVPADAPVTAARALNRALQQGRGRVLALIAGGRGELDPQLLRRAAAALDPAETVIVEQADVGALFVPRHLPEQVGGLDERLSATSEPAMTSELRERMTTTPGARLVSLTKETTHP